MSIVCKIDFSVNDDPGSMRAFLERMEFAVRRDDHSDILVDLAKCRYLGPDAVTVLAAIRLDMLRLGRTVVVQPPDGPASLRRFYQWSGLDAVMAGHSPSDVHVGDDFNVLPLRAFSAANIRASEPIANMVKSRLHISDEWHEYLATCVNEVMQNIQDHAQSPIGGLMSARFMVKTQEVRVAIVDRGIGVFATLKRRFEDTTPDNALKRVVEGGYSALSRQNNAGLGISHLRSIVDALNGKLFIISSESAFALKERQHRYNLWPFQFGGTGVFFSLPVQET